MKIKQDSLKLHEKLKGKIQIKTKIKINQKNLSLLYTPGVSYPSLEIAKNKNLAYDYTNKWNNVAIITDGSRLLGLGNKGAYASMPVMEGKAMLFKEYGDVDAYPICLKTQDQNEIVQIVKNLEPVFGAINLEDIESPKCFYIQRELKNILDIPVFHDDQDGTSVVVLAALINSLKIVKKNFKDSKITIIGAGAAGLGISHLLLDYGAKNLDLFDSNGLIFKGRKQGMNKFKEEITKRLRANKEHSLEESLTNCDVLIGVSGKANSLDKNLLKKMNKNSILLALTNPVPEISYKDAKSAGVRICASGGSPDYKNHVNNMLAFPAIFRGTLDVRARQINKKMLIAAAEALANFVKKPNENNIIPKITEKGLLARVSNAVAKAARKSNVARI